MKVTNVSGQTLVLPNGTEVKRGESCELTNGDLKNVGVVEFIDLGWFEETKVAAKAKSGE